MISPLLNEVVAGRAPEPLLFTTDQYHRLTETGVILEGSPVELIEGVIVWKDRRDAKGSLMNHGPQHSGTVSQLSVVLNAELAGIDVHTRCQLPVILTANSEPEPDLAVVRGPASGFFHRQPSPDDLLAVIEVSYGSKRFDRTTKQRIYASANIPVYWIVSLPDRLVEVYEQPDSATGKYLSTSTVDETGQVQLSLPGGVSIVVSVADFLPPTTT